MVDFVIEPAFWASLVLLIGMEVVLGANNVVFISTLAAKLPERYQQRIVQIGLAISALFRLVLLVAIVWVLGLQRTAFTLAGWSPSWRELILLVGGFFLAYRAVTELHLLVEPESGRAEGLSFTSSTPALTIAQLIFINAAFSVDSVITAIGLSTYVEAMAIALIVSIIILYFTASAMEALIARHPSIKALALGFLLMVSTVLITDGLGFDTEPSYLYPTMILAVLMHVGITLARLRYSPSQTTVALDSLRNRTEPILAPGVAEIEETPTQRVEPVLTTQAVEDTDQSVVDVAGEGGVEHLDADDDVFDDNSDLAPLGEEDMPVQRSRRKRPVLRRRPQRLRTARRRE